MKVGIITIHRATNYGALFQAYALKTKLRMMGQDAELVDYRSSFIEDFYTKPVSKWNSLKTNVKNILTWKVQKKRNREFANFIKTYLECTETTSIYNNNLEKTNEMYDVFIAGSDQIWNPFCTGNDKAYFLDFVGEGKRKYSYAASLGNIKDSFVKNKTYIELLDKFDGISVREKKGQNAVKQMLNKDVQVHLDPTFLIGKENWLELIKPVKEKKYVFVYSLSMPESMVEVVEKYAEINELNVVYVTLNNLFTIVSGKKKVVKTCSPEEFLSYLYYADAVFTNSFHGVALSLILNKQLFVKKNENPNHDNSRLENILELLGLENRFIVGDKWCNEQIEYNDVNEKLKELIKDSEDYLRGIIEDEVV